MRKHFFVVFLFCFGTFSLSAQQSRLDSMLSALGSVKIDSVKARVLNRVSEEYWRSKNFDKTKDFANRSLEISNSKINLKNISTEELDQFEDLAAISYNNLANIFRFQD